MRGPMLKYRRREVDEKLETLETSCLLDISGGVTGFRALAKEGWGDLRVWARRRSIRASAWRASWR
jgi:hypothetical protein